MSVEAEESDCLEATLDGVLPLELPPRSAAAMLVVGSCFHRSRTVREQRIVVDGVPHPPAAQLTPRPALLERLRRDGRISGEDVRARVYRSGFWGVVPVRGRAPGQDVVVEVEVELANGAVERAELGRIPVRDPEPGLAPAAASPADAIAICMATFEPDPELFSRQVASLREQTDRSWFCLVSDDCSEPAAFAAIEAEIGEDPRFVVSRSERRLGFYRNFERALRMVPADARLVALCDQDDRWYPDKLATLREAIGDGVLAYGDQRRVDRAGRVINETLWRTRRRNDSNFASMLLANTIVGASALFDRRLLDVALPFPEAPGWQFHDHWLSVVALACGEVAYVDRPLYDYVQHEGAIVGRVGVEARDVWRPSIPRGLALRGRAVYFRSYLHLVVQARTILERGGTRLEPRDRRAAARLAAADSSIAALLWLALRPLRRLAGRNETLGTEGHLLAGLAWRRLVTLLAGRSKRPIRRLETELPPFDIDGFGQRRLKRWLAGS